MTAPAAQDTITYRIYQRSEGAPVSEQADPDTIDPERDLCRAPEGTIAVRYLSDRPLVFEGSTSEKSVTLEGSFYTGWYYVPQVTVISGSSIVRMSTQTRTERNQKARALALIDRDDPRSSFVAMVTVRRGRLLDPEERGNKEYFSFDPARDKVLDL